MVALPHTRDSVESFLASQLEQKDWWGLVAPIAKKNKKGGTAGNRTQIATDKGACSGLVKGRRGTCPLPPNQVSKAVSRRQLDGTNAKYSRDTTTRQFRGLDWSGGM
jgi:hypothetical protein